jgi:hypothetical protein
MFAGARAMAMAMAFKATTVTATRYPAKYHVAVAETLNKECNSDRGPKKQQCPAQPTSGIARYHFREIAGRHCRGDQ